MTDVKVLYRPGWGTREVQVKGQGHGQNYQREKQEIIQKQVCQLRKPRVRLSLEKRYHSWDLLI